ncbi:MAG: hydrogenase 3 maturation endopeptidase HyCI [Phototrophicaceae bacterium]
MSSSLWQTSLATVLQTTKSEPPGRVAVLGVGQELRGDDAAGLAVIRALIQGLPPTDNLLLLDTGPSPEAFTGSLRQFGPDWVLFVDAADMDAEPGAVAWVSDEAITGLSASTHTLPVSVMAKYMLAEFGCKIALLGIQPQQTELDAPLSAPVTQAVAAVTAAFEQAITPRV